MNNDCNHWIRFGWGEGEEGINNHLWENMKNYPVNNQPSVMLICFPLIGTKKTYPDNDQP